MVSPPAASQGQDGSDAAARELGVVGSAQALSKGPVLPRDRDFDILVVSPGCV